jgi:Tol biopolymer transport system component
MSHGLGAWLHLAWIGIAAALVVATATVARTRAPVAPAETRLDVVVPATDDPWFALSPDARAVAFVVTRNGGGAMLSVRALDSTAPRVLPGTDDATNPFWSPDSESIGFFANRRLKRIDLRSGSVQVLTDATPIRGDAAWAADGSILFHPLGPGHPELYRLTAGTGVPVKFTTLEPGATGHVHPRFLPDGRRFLYFANGAPNVRGVYLSSLDDPRGTRLMDAESGAQFLAPDWLLYERDAALMARHVDVKEKRVFGEPTLIAEGLVPDPQGRQPNSPGRTPFSVSADGVIAYRTGGPVRRQLTWFDRTGRTLGTLGDVDDTMFSPALSPDGRRVAVSRIVQGNQDIWIIDQLHTTRLTFDAADDRLPWWSPDGSRVVYSSLRAGRNTPYEKRADGTGAEEKFADGPTPEQFLIGPTDWSRDGRFMLIDQAPNDIWVVDIGDQSKSFKFLGVQAPIATRLARFSPDASWVAYQSNETGRAEVYIRTFPAGGGQRQVSTAGGAQPLWSHDGRELYWIAPDAKLMAAPIAFSGASATPGPPVVLFQTHILMGGADQPARGQYAVAADGRFLINTVVDEEAVMPITIIQHWRGK